MLQEAVSVPEPCRILNLSVIFILSQAALPERDTCFILIVTASKLYGLTESL